MRSVSHRKISEWELATIAITDYILSHRRIRRVFLGMEWEINDYKKINDKNFCSKENLIDIQKKKKKIKDEKFLLARQIECDHGHMGIRTFMSWILVY